MMALAIALPDTQIDFVMPKQTTYMSMVLPEHYFNILYWDGKSAGLPDNLYHYSCHPELGTRLIARDRMQIVTLRKGVLGKLNR